MTSSPMTRLAFLGGLPFLGLWGSFAHAAERLGHAAQVQPLLDKYCVACHGTETKKADLDLGQFRGANERSLLAAVELWQDVAAQVSSHDMPPDNKPQPTPAEVEILVAWAEQVEERAFAQGKRDPGRVTLRRLNRPEFNNTVRDLLGLDSHPAQDFPSDDVGYGFDNIGDVLTMPPVLVERYLAASERIAERTIISRPLRHRRGRFGGAVLPVSHTRIIPRASSNRSHQKDAREFLGALANRAFRRPATAVEVENLARFVDQTIEGGGSFERGMQLALRAVLLSPSFLYRPELDPDDPTADSAEIRPLTQWELASRLSYFLWSSMPDEALFTRARSGSLQDPAILESEVKRMLSDPKSEALARNFATQWLQIRGITTHSPNRKQFPDFDSDLTASMLTETEMFFGEVVRQDLNVLSFLDAEFTFVNERLAKHYGIADVLGPSFRKVSLTGTGRGGVLTQGSVLTVTSNPNRTSPVKRGRWVLEQLLGTPPPPPPPGIPNLKEKGRTGTVGTVRARMEQHRTDPNCAVCHKRMDPLGLGLENFNAVGVWREKDENQPIDSSGTLPGGQTFVGPTELRKILMGRETQFRKTLASKLLTYALGRGVEGFDRPALDKITTQMASQQNTFSSLVVAIATSDPFMNRRSREIQP